MDKKNKYKPVKHTKATTARLLAGDPDLKKTYDELEDEFAALDALLYPKPVKLSARCTCWHVEDIRELIERIEKDSIR